ncbi:MAG: RNA 2',3'-cyclic phosphodiesterase [Gemmatimonadales bacterium]
MRLFIALNLPDDVRRPLWDALGPLRATPLPVRWVSQDNIHVSLKFLGEVDEGREPALRDALRAAAQRAGGKGITLQVGGFGAFPDVRRPQVLWAGVEPDPALELLQHEVERAFAPLGFATDARPFRPHLTLGRARRTARPRAFQALAATMAALEFTATTVVADLDLMQSRLQPDGPQYVLRQRERLS